MGQPIPKADVERLRGMYQGLRTIEPAGDRNRHGITVFANRGQPHYASPE